MELWRWWQLLALLLLLLSSGVASAQTNWPDFMSQLHPGLSQSPVSAVVWSVNIEPPPHDLPAEKAKWSGRWAGWACEHQVCDTKLIVEKVTAQGAHIIYGFASAEVKPLAIRAEANFVGEELQATLRNGSKLAYRMRKEGDVEFLVRTSDGRSAAGVLSKEK